MPLIEPGKCDGCGLCVSVCEARVLTIVGGVVVTIETLACGWCTLCEAICPTGAITCPYEIVVKE